MEKNQPLISIITVVYNSIGTLERTILSVINQTYNNIEYIIIDGGSTDGTIDIIKKYEDKITFWVSEPDKGIYDAMNKALNIANGDFLFFLNSGDSFYSENTISSVSRKINNWHNVYYGDVYLLNLNKTYWGKFTKNKLAIGNICHQSIFYSKNIYSTYVYDLSYQVFADYAYNISIYSKTSFIYLNEIIAYYENEGISTFQKDKPFKKNINKIILKNLGLIPILCRFIYWKLVAVKKLLKHVIR